jgi:hypothetical protein
MNKNKKVTIGLIFGTLAFIILFFKMFNIIAEIIFHYMCGPTVGLILLCAEIFLIFSIVFQSINLGYYIEAYLKEYNILKEPENENNNKESEDNII